MPERDEMFLLGDEHVTTPSGLARTNSDFHISLLGSQVQRCVRLVRMVRVLQVCRIGIQYSFD
jgi:hypothetical protein